MTSDDAVRCKDCGLSIPDGDQIPRKPCENCGSKAREISASVSESISVSVDLAWETRKEFYEKNHKALVLVILIAVLSPFLGLVVAGIPGIGAGLILSATSYFLSPHAITTVREIERGK